MTYNQNKIVSHCVMKRTYLFSVNLTVCVLERSAVNYIKDASKKAQTHEQTNPSHGQVLTVASGGTERPYL